MAVYEKMAQRWPSDDFSNQPRIVSQCTNCVFYDPENSMTCKAFPGGIPSEILTNAFDHRREWPGDNGIHYLPLSRIPHPLDGKEADPDSG